MEKKKRTGQIILLLIIAVIGAVVVGVRLHLSAKMANEEALLQQLGTVRMSVELYLKLNSKFPLDLKTLTTEKYTIKDNRSFYLVGVKVDKDGHPLDSFGNKFEYDPASGRVWTSTKGYGNW